MIRPVDVSGGHVLLRPEFGFTAREWVWLRDSTTKTPHSCRRNSHERWTSPQTPCLRHQVHLSSTMGKGVPVEVATVDPSSPRFMLIDEDTETAVKKALEAERAKESPRQEEGGVGGEQISM